MLEQDYTLRIKRYKPTDPRLGRHVRHDSRSLQFQVEAAPLGSLKSIRHARYIPNLNQGQLGSCTGHAAIGCLGTGTFWGSPVVRSYLSATTASIDQQRAVSTYSEATVLDPYPGSYPPVDSGSDGLSVAKVLQKHGMISGYEHATSLEATLTALSKQPVIVGTVWKYDMFRPAPDGKMSVTGSAEGGHEYVLDELDTEKKIVWINQTWGEIWGVHSRAYMTWDDLGLLLDDDGDCTVFTPINQPAPTPTPPAPPAPPAPKPTDAVALISQAQDLLAKARALM